MLPTRHQSSTSKHRLYASQAHGMLWNALERFSTMPHRNSWSLSPLFWVLVPLPLIFNSYPILLFLLSCQPHPKFDDQTPAFSFPRVYRECPQTPLSSCKPTHGLSAALPRPHGYGHPVSHLHRAPGFPCWMTLCRYLAEPRMHQ